MFDCQFWDINTATGLIYALNYHSEVAVIISLQHIQESDCFISILTLCR